MERKNVRIHPTAEVADSAQIGEGTSIWHQAQIRENVKIGRNCNIGKDVYIDSGVVIGNNVKIQNGVSVYHGVEVEDFVFLGPHCVTTNDMYPRSRVGDFKVYETKIRKGASICAGAVLVCGITIGEYAMVGAGAVATRDIPAHALVVGSPAKIIGFVCECGQKAEKQGEENGRAQMRCASCGKTFEVEKEIWLMKK
ncbi:N-acetyltransferase [Candidatus Micrarchaeota archaeon]|nr:N-acetyltransferase [Candidatus Micrarchaeota archaeon]